MTRGEFMKVRGTGKSKLEFSIILMLLKNKNP